MLRITDQMNYLSNQQRLAQSQYRLSVRQREATTGKRINQPADDPAGAASILRMDAELSQVDQCQKNITRVRGELEEADNAMASMNELLIRAKELAVSMSNDSHSADERAVTAEEIRHIREQIVSLANTKHNDIYIFGGFQSAVPVDDTGAYSTDTEVRKIEVSPGLYADVSISAQDILNPASGPDALQVLQDLDDALVANDLDGIRDSLDSLKASEENLGEARSRAGTYLNRLNNYETLLGNRTLQLTSDRAQVGEVDAVQAMTEMVQAQQSLNASIQVAAKVLSTLSLVGQL